MPTDQYMTQTYGSFCYAKAQNLRLRLCAAYDAILSEYDLLLMPTLPMTTPQLPVACAPVDEIIARARNGAEHIGVRPRRTRAEYLI